MMDYQSFICKECGRVVLRVDGTRFCQYCGARLPEIKKPLKVTCPMCHGTGEIEQRKGQPIQPPFVYFNNNIESNKKEDK